MYTYCLNNPITFSDCSGTSASFAYICVDDGGNGYIYDQKSKTVKNMPLGIANVGHSGCGPIALYNTLKLLGQNNVSLAQIIEYYETNNYLICAGLLGTQLYGCVRFLEEQGYIVMVVPNTDKNDDIANIADACILWYCYRQSNGPPLAAHYVAFSQIDGIGSYYNAYKRQETVYTHKGGANSFMKGYAEGGFGGILICVFRP